MTPEQFIDALAARNVSVIVVHNRIRTKPADAYKALTDGEMICWHRYRNQIKALVISGYQSTAEPKPEPEPEPLKVFNIELMRRVTDQDLIDANTNDYEQASEWLTQQHRHKRATLEMSESLRRQQRGPFWQMGRSICEERENER